MGQKDNEVPEIRFRPKDRGAFRIGVNVGELWEGESQIVLRPKQWQLLRYLAARPGKPILKTEILDSIWGVDVGVQPQIVDQTLTGLRQRLGDRAKGSQFIETVFGGLRFIADVETGARTTTAIVTEMITFKVDWCEPPYSVITLHVDQPLFESYPTRWFYRSHPAEDCPDLYRRLLAGPGLTSVERNSAYALSMGKDDLAEYVAVVNCIKLALTEITGVQVVSAAASGKRKRTPRMPTPAALASLQRLAAAGKEFNGASYPLERNMADGADYLDKYPPEFDAWVLEAKAEVAKVSEQESFERSLVDEGMEVYRSFKTFKRRSDLDRIQHLLLRALEATIQGFPSEPSPSDN